MLGFEVTSISQVVEPGLKSTHYFGLYDLDRLGSGCTQYKLQLVHMSMEPSCTIRLFLIGAR